VSATAATPTGTLTKKDPRPAQIGGEQAAEQHAHRGAAAGSRAQREERKPDEEELPAPEQIGQPPAQQEGAADMIV
jgi:hypothetical protein